MFRDIISRLFRKEAKAEKTNAADYMCKYVVQDSAQLGECISVTGQKLLVKSGNDILAIPITAVVSTSKENVVVGAFDRDEAKKNGGEWQASSTKLLVFDENGMLVKQ
ncbi:MAG TPA: hypothetical protein HA257_00710 [Candidatus Methanoperedenaceae archaeon]|nr:hypothetical protein [Candidatus Methanoperedenaceae archaeon]